MVNHIFGYLKPYNNELKLKDTTEYKSLYCTVCYGLRKHLGRFSASFLNFESVFLYIFLDGVSCDREAEQLQFRCPINPLKNVTTRTDDVLLEYVSFINYSLVLLKLADNIRDTKKIKYNLIYKVLSRRKKYSQLLSKYREVWDSVNKSYDLLYELESNGITDYDTCSKAMGAVLQEIVRFYYVYSQIEADSVVIKFAEHLGMWIYLIDAYDDLEDDLKRNAFNPLYSFSTKIDEIERKEECFKSGKLMLILMRANLLRMMGGISLCRHVDIIKNIVQFGTQAAVEKIEKKGERGNGIEQCDR